MCRFALYLGSPIVVGSLVTDPAHSLIHQSHASEEREEPLNGDGFGLAWYVPDVTDEPAVFKDVTPAWSNENLASLARVTVTGCLLAHVRAASPGLPVMRANCHPFTWGRFAFMHNGYVGGFRRLVRPLRDRLSDESWHMIRGTTDSEHVLGLFADRYRSLDSGSPLERMAAALLGAIHDVDAVREAAGVEDPASLNLAVADGRRAVISRYVSFGGGAANSLYVHAGGRYACEDGQCRMLPPEHGERAVIAASEPLSRDPGWRRVPANRLVLIDEDLSVEERLVEHREPSRAAV